MVIVLSCVGLWYLIYQRLFISSLGSTAKHNFFVVPMLMAEALAMLIESRSIEGLGSHRLAL